MNKSLLGNALIILVIGVCASFVPFLHISAIFGFPAVVLNTIILTIVFRKELSK